MTTSEKKAVQREERRLINQGWKANTLEIRGHLTPNEARRGRHHFVNRAHALTDR